MLEQTLAKKKLKEILKSDDLLLATIPSLLFHPYRILIMNILYKHGQVDFRDLKNDLNLTAGNLASHLRALKNEGYIIDNKTIIGNRPRTSYEFTEKGLNAFRDFRESLLGVFKDE